MQIDANHHGIILTTDLLGTVVGLATDGDIRRKLLEGVSLDEPIAACSNAEFIWVTPDTPREMLSHQGHSHFRCGSKIDRDCEQ